MQPLSNAASQVAGSLAGASRLRLGRRAVLAGLASAAACRSSRAAIVDLVAVGRDGWLFPIWDEVRHVDLTRIAPVAAVVTEAADLLARANIQVAFALTPAKSRIYKDFLPSDFSFVPDTEKRYAVGLQRLRAARGAVAVDIAPTLAALRSASSADPVFFKGDTHWTAVGAQATAVEVARQIKASFKLPPSQQPGSALGPPVMADWERDDLAGLLPAAERAQYPIESYTIRQPAQTGGGGLLDDDGADVVVIGNSFMQPRLGFAAMLSNQLGRPVSLTWRVHQIGPYQTMLAYFDSDAFRRRKPAVVVWNFHETDMTIPSDRRDGWGQNVIAPQVFLAKLRQVLGVV